MRRSVLILALLSGFQAVIAQHKDFSKDFFPDNRDGLKAALSQLKEGNKIFDLGEAAWYRALPYFLEAYRFNPDNAELNYKIGLAYLHSSFKYEALPYLEKAFTLNPALTPDLQFMLGRAYHLIMKWDDAMDAYKRYRKTLNESTQQKEIRQVIKLINECINGKEAERTPVRVFIDNVGGQVNSKHGDYSPLITADASTMIFTSRRETSTGGKTDPVSGHYFEDIFFTHSPDGKTWTIASNPGKPLNTDDHDATVGVSADGTMLIIYKGSGQGDLYFCKQEGELWGKPEKLDKTINTDYHESSACLSPDGRSLYFVSNRPDLSKGGHDIFISRLNEKGKWGEPENLGPVINTIYEEESVYMHPDGRTLFFSSTGHKSIGGFDIFKTTYENGGWSEPVSLGYPVNTPDDDLFFVLAANGKTGYYASVRPEGHGEKDIYRITFLGPEKPVMLTNEDNLLAGMDKPVAERVMEPVVEVEKVRVTLLRGIISDAVSGQPLQAQIELYDNEKNVLLATFNSNSKTGRYLVSLPSGKNYGISVKKDGCLFHSENFDIPALAEYQEVYRDVMLKNIAVGSTIVLRNIFFDSNRYTIRPESAGELERLLKLLNDVPSLRIEIAGHTDNVGSEQSNMKLSENRARAVVEYLVSHGIKADRLSYKGYGETSPVADNTTGEGRQENRRTEFVILSN